MNGSKEQRVGGKEGMGVELVERRGKARKRGWKAGGWGVGGGGRRGGGWGGDGRFEKLPASLFTISWPCPLNLPRKKSTAEGQDQISHPVFLDETHEHGTISTTVAWY